MFKRRFLLMLELGSIILISLTISSFAINSPPLRHGSTGAFYNRHTSLTGLAQTSNKYHLDCFRRQYNFHQENSSALDQMDASNYFLTLS